MQWFFDHFAQVSEPTRTLDILAIVLSLGVLAFGVFVMWMRHWWRRKPRVQQDQYQYGATVVESEVLPRLPERVDRRG